MPERQKLIAEALGTFMFCFAGIAAMLGVHSPISSGMGLIGIALAHSLALAVAVNCFGGISGAHFNPAVTLGFLSVGRIKFGEALRYIIAQIVGASGAAWACLAVFPKSMVDAAKLGIPLPAIMPGAEVEWPTVGTILIVEFLLSFLLMIAIYGTAVDPRGKSFNISAFGIGLAVTFDILAGGPITGASMNPARSFGPALVYNFFGGESGASAFELHWCYWVAPIAGVVVAALIYESLILSNQER